MFARDFSITDIERLGPIIEQLLASGKLTEEEKWAVDLSCRAAVDWAHMRHLEAARQFYARPDMQERAANGVVEWLAENRDAPPGTVTAICGRLYVASWGVDGTLNLYPIRDL